MFKSSSAEKLCDRSPLGCVIISCKMCLTKFNGTMQPEVKFEENEKFASLLFALK